VGKRKKLIICYRRILLNKKRKCRGNEWQEDEGDGDEVMGMRVKGESRVIGAGRRCTWRCWVKRGARASVRKRGKAAEEYQGNAAQV
jgi:hypothetical protein